MVRTTTLIAGMVAAASALQAPAQVESISGTLRDERGRPLAGAPVEVVRPGRGVRLTPDDRGPQIYFVVGPEDAARTTTDVQGTFKVQTQDRGWHPGAGYVMKASTPDRKTSVERPLTLKLGPNETRSTRVSVFEPTAHGPGVGNYPSDYPSVYARATGGALLMDRHSVKAGRTDAQDGPGTVGPNATQFSPAAGGAVGYQLNKAQAVEMNYFGSWLDALKTVDAAAYSFSLIDGSASVANIHPARFDSKYTADWSDIGLDYAHRVLDSDPWVVIARGGLAGGFFDQSFESRIMAGSARVEALDEKVNDSYLGPRVGVEVQHRFCRNWWAGLGMNIGGVFGFADFTGRETALVGTEFQHLRVRDHLDYTGVRVGTTVGLGWAPVRWASFEAGYRFEYWTDAPRIMNPSVAGTGLTPDVFSSPAHLDTESLLLHGVMGTVSARFW